VLVGLPELRDRLALRRNRSLHLRLHHRLEIAPLTPDDTAEYLRLRLRRAGCDRELFAHDATALLHEATAGAVRDLDRLAAAALRETAPPQARARRARPHRPRHRGGHPRARALIADLRPPTPSPSRSTPPPARWPSAFRIRPRSGSMPSRHCRAASATTMPINQAASGQPDAPRPASTPRATCSTLNATVSAVSGASGGVTRPSSSTPDRATISVVEAQPRRRLTPSACPARWFPGRGLCFAGQLPRGLSHFLHFWLCEERDRSYRLCVRPE
jgi:hypothetical protein